MKQHKKVIVINKKPIVIIFVSKKNIKQKEGYKWEKRLD
jgi:hypothetical protein